MNFDFVTNATAKELEQFKSVCNQLLSRTYIVRTIYQPGKGRVDNPDYLFLSRHYEAVQEYLSLLDWDLRRDELNGYFYVLNTDEANRCNLNEKRNGDFAGITADLRRKYGAFGFGAGCRMYCAGCAGKSGDRLSRFFRLSRIWKRSNARLRYWKTIL